MALFIPGGPAGGAPSGALGSMVFSHGRFGAYLRSRVIPTNPATAGQVSARNRLSSLTNHWYNTLTAPQRAAWTTYGSNVPVTNRIGQQIFLTGLNWYVACNSLRLQAAGVLSRVDDAPTVFNLSSFTVTAITASESTQVISCAYDAGDNWEKDDGGLFTYATRPQNSSINFNAKPYRFGGFEEGDTAVPPTSPFLMTAPFPFVQGQKLFGRFNCAEADGRIGAVQKFSCIAAA